MNNIDKNYIPAIITALAGISGIIINICLDIYFRRIDRRISRKEKQIFMLENYYIPLLSRTSRMWDQFSNLPALKKLSFEDLFDYFNDTENKSIDEIGMVLNVKSSLVDLNNFINSNDYKFLGNYKLYVNQMHLFNFIRLLNENQLYKIRIDNDNLDLSIEIIDKFNKNLKREIEYVYSPNIFYFTFIMMKNHFRKKDII